VSKPFFGSLALAVSLALCLSSPVSAAGNATVREGTELHLQLLEQLSSANAVIGQRFNLKLEEDLRVNGVLIAPQGAMAVGSVVNTKKRGMMGRAGELDVRLDYLLIGDTHVPLRATSGQTGKSGVGATVALTVLFGPIGLLKRGKDVVMPQGMSIPAYVDQSTDVAVIESAAPMSAPTAAAPAPAAETSTPAAGAPAAPAASPSPSAH